MQVCCKEQSIKVWAFGGQVALSDVQVVACRRIDEPFAQHLELEGLEFLQFTFR